MILTTENDGIITKIDFCNGVREIAMSKSMTWLDATVAYCEKHDIDFDMVPSLLDKGMKEALEADGLSLHLLKRNDDEITI